MAMQTFQKIPRKEPAKRSAVDRVQDFKEVVTVFGKEEAREQASRCLSCGIAYCMDKCPLYNVIPYWLKSMEEGNIKTAFRLSQELSPFPEILGKICPQDKLCEGGCTLAVPHGAVTIGSVETAISELGFSQGLVPEYPGVTSDKKVAVIGSGPAGMSAATFLLRAGIGVTMYEKSSEPGGLMVFGIPSFKLDKSVITRRMQWLQDAGLDLRLGQEVGTTISFAEILAKHDAVYLGLGASKAHALGIGEEQTTDVIQAMDYLTTSQKSPTSKKATGKTVVVIGGGDTAMDCIRTTLREGAREVIAVYRRDETSMPCSRKEFQYAIEEGAKFQFQSAPIAIQTDSNNTITGLVIAQTKLEKKPNERPTFTIDNNATTTIPCDLIISALGFKVAMPAWVTEAGIQTDETGKIIIDEHFTTTNPNVYAGGDCTRGASLAVYAAFDGREAVKSMVRKLG